MTDAPAVASPPPTPGPDRVPRHVLAWIFLCGMLPSLVLAAGWQTSFVWAAVVSVGVYQVGPRGIGRSFGGGLLALLGSVALLFFSGWDLRPLALLLFLPAGVGWGLAQILGEPFVERVRRAPFLFAVLYCLAVLGPYQAGASFGPFPAINDDWLYGLRATATPEPLSQEEQLAALDVVHASLRGESIDAGGLPERLLEPHPHRLWVTLFRTARRDRSARGMARGPLPLHEALALAARDAAESAPRGGRWTSDLAQVRIVVDLGGPERTIRPRWPRRAIAWAVRKAMRSSRFKFDLIVYDAEPGLDGFILQGEGDAEGVVLPADHLIQGWLTPRSRRRRYRTHNFEALHKRLARRAGLPGKTPAGSLPLTTFRTWSFAQPDPAERRTVELFRGNVLFEGEVTEEVLLDRIDLAGEWLLSTVEPSGRFDYEYFPNKDDHGSSYNEVRHAGSVYGLFHMFHMAEAEPALRDDAEAYLRAGVLTLDRVYGNLGKPPGTTAADPFVAFLEGEDGENTNSGAAALTLLSFVERPPPEQVRDPALKTAVWTEGDAEIMEGLAETLVAMVDERGAVFRMWTEAQAGGLVEKEPPYFPGEVMLALVRYHELTQEERWLQTAQAIGRRQIRLARRWWMVPDHWVMQALDRLDEIDTGNDEWRRGAYAMGRRYVREQFAPLGRVLHPGPRQRPPFPDYRGAYRRMQEVPRTTRAASRGEAIGGVVRIAWRHGDPSAHWERSLIEGARHLMEQQYVPDNSFFLPNPDEVQGAIRMGIVDMHCRIDNNQHGVVGLGNALAALRRGSE